MSKHKHHQTGADSCACGELWPCGKLKTIRWKQSRDGFVESHDGRWRITPLFCGSTRAQEFELSLDNKVIDRFCESQRDAKEAAERFIASRARK